MRLSNPCLRDVGLTVSNQSHPAWCAALCAAGTLWRLRLVFTEQGPRERVAGLDYAGLRVVLDGLQLSLGPEDWQQLRVLEAAAVAAMNGEPG